jgi:hypothetical protein
MAPTPDEAVGDAHRFALFRRFDRNTGRDTARMGSSSARGVASVGRISIARLSLYERLM